MREAKAYLDRGDTGRKDEAHVVGVNHHHDANHTSGAPPAVLPRNLLLPLRVAFSKFRVQESCPGFRGHKSQPQTVNQGFRNHALDSEGTSHNPKP
jgi:hypothetical protein